MQNELITIEEYVRESHTDIHFINQLGEYGLIEITLQEQRQYLPSNQLPLLEKYTRLHYDLDINMEGIEAISHLLQRIEDMQSELSNLKRTLRIYGTSAL